MSTWYFAHNKKKIGPLTWEELRQAAVDGPLGPSDMVLEEGKQQWAEAASVPGLFEAGEAKPKPSRRSNQGSAVPIFLIFAGAAAALVLLVMVPILGVAAWFMLASHDVAKEPRVAEQNRPLAIVAEEKAKPEGQPAAKQEPIKEKPFVDPGEKLPPVPPMPVAAIPANLMPTRVRLNLKDTPLPEAVADLSKRIGHLIFLDDPKGKLQERRITLDTGDVTFWEALDQLCAKGGLVEGLGQISFNASPLPVQPFPQPGQPFPAPGGDSTPSFRVIRRVISLKEGKPAQTPTDYSTAVRFKAIGNPHGFVNSPTMSEFRLMVNPEPRFYWKSLTAVRVDRATDEHGQNLGAESPMAPVGPPPGIGVFGGGDPPGFGKFGGGMPGKESDNIEYVPIRLRQGAKESTTIKELRGTVSAEVSVVGEEVLAVKDLVGSVGKTVPGPAGSFLTVVKVGAVGAQDLAELQVKWNLPPGTLEPIPPGLQMFHTPPQGLRVYDARGDRIAVVSVSRVQGDNDEVTQVKVRLAKNQTPARLSLSTCRTIPLEIPFVLREIAVKKAGVVFP